VYVSSVLDIYMLVHAMHESPKFGLDTIFTL